jgi:hypothetical protein
LSITYVFQYNNHMQDEDTKVGEEIVTVPVEEVTPPVVQPVPVAESVVTPDPVLAPEPTSEPIPEPSPEPVVESLPESAPEPIYEPIPEPAPVTEVPVVVPKSEPVIAPEKAPLLAPTPLPVVVEPVAPKVEPEAVRPVEEKPVETPAPVSEAPKEQGGIPQKVLVLTPEELDAARRLWASRTIRETQKVSVQARKEKVTENLKRVEHFVKKYGPTTVRTVGLELSMSSRSASAYLMTLASQGKIQVTGATTSRRYS